MRLEIHRFSRRGFSSSVLRDSGFSRTWKGFGPNRLTDSKSPPYSMAPPAAIDVSEEAGALVLHAAGDWLVTEAAGLDRRLRALRVPSGRPVVVDAAGIERLDTAGAWLLLRTERELAGRGTRVTLTNLRAEPRCRYSSSCATAAQSRRQRTRSRRTTSSPAFSRALARSRSASCGAATRSSDSAASSSRRWRGCSSTQAVCACAQR